MNAYWLTIGITSLVVAASVYTDLRYAKIYNKLVLPCIPLGVMIWGIADGWNGVLFSMGGVAIGSIALLAAGAFRLLAPGDAKLIVAVGALTGARFVGSAMVYCALAGGLIALFFLLKNRMLKPLAATAVAAWANQTPISTMWTSRTGYIPYSCAVAAGVALAALIPIW